ncbi:NADP-dependent oxidoreductase domain-containing protein [Lipomyces starkeyi]
MILPTTQLGKDDPQVTAIGLGAWYIGISAYYEPKLDDEAAFTILDKALELGCTFWDTARIYNNNEQVIGRWLPRPATDGSPQCLSVRAKTLCKDWACRRSTCFYQHRMNGTLPIEVTVSTMADLVKERIRYLGLSECSLRRAPVQGPTSPRMSGVVQVPRFQKDNFDTNMKLRDEFKKIAVKNYARPGEVALARLIAKGANPIPGTTKITRLIFLTSLLV